MGKHRQPSTDTDYYRRIMGTGHILSDQAASDLRHIDDALYGQIEEWCRRFGFHLWTNPGPEPARQITQHIRYSIYPKAVSDWFDGRKLVWTQLVTASLDHDDAAIVDDVSDRLASLAEGSGGMETAKVVIAFDKARKHPLLVPRGGPTKIVWLEWIVTQRVLRLTAG